MRIAAVADVHSPRYLNEFQNALAKCKIPDLFLLAGDMVDYGKFEEYRNISDAITNQFGDEMPIVACFGNDEMGTSLQNVYDIVGEKIKFLDGDTVVIPHNGRKIGILGVPMLDVNNSLKNKSLEEIFERRIRHLGELLEELQKSCDKLVLLLHYSPISTETYPETFSWWVSNAFKNAQPDVIVHGHIHYAIKSDVRIGSTQVINVAFPATHKVTELQI